MPPLSPLSAILVRPLSALLSSCLLLSACGGGEGGETASSVLALAPTLPASLAAHVTASESFPTGLAIVSPTESSAGMATRIEAVLTGGGSVSLAGLLDFSELFQQGGDAGCYGPPLLYANHEDASGTASGLLPSGALGLWQATDAATGQPCVVAQLKARGSGLQHTTRQGLLLVAAMRATIAGADGLLAMPAAGFTTDLTTPFRAVLVALPAFTGLHLHAATVALDPFGKTYTYRLAVSDGTGSTARSGEVVLKHRPGATASVYSGVLRVTGFDLTTDAASGCSDRTTSGRYQRARATTVRYSRDADQIDFGARTGQYCGAPASLTDADHAAQVAAFTASDELDPAVPLATGTSTGWRGHFDRLGGHYDRTTGAGQFLHVWQASTGDLHARALAATSTHNSATDRRTVQGYFAFTDTLATTDGSLLGMVCNGQGPGVGHTPVPLFQSQSATLVGSASVFTATASRLAYAPTRTCSSTTTVFDADADGTLWAGEGLGAVQALDAPVSPSVTVQGELVSRGYRQPGYF